MKRKFPRICILFFVAILFAANSNAQVTLAISSSTNISCNSGNNGTASVTPTGVGPYSFLWSPSGITNDTATGLIAGNYTCTVTDSSDMSTATATVTLTQPNVLTATQSQVNVSCNGGNNGTTTVVPSGGTAPYTYAWLPTGGNVATVTGRSVGTYTCNITDAHGCAISKTFTISQPLALTATQSQVNVMCNGGNNGSATVVVSGGTAGYSYAWIPSGGTTATANNLAAGNYTCTITDANSCVLTKTFLITTLSTLSATTSSTQASCSAVCNGSATIIPSGGTGPYAYWWSPSGGSGGTATGLCAGTYTCTVTDANGCTCTRTATVTNANSLTANIVSTTNISCFGAHNGCATASGGVSYIWMPGSMSGATVCGLGVGNFTVTVTDMMGCTATAVTTITQPAQLAATSSSTPSDCNNVGGSATVAPSGGTSPYSYSWTPTGGTAATANNLSAGTYSCLITDANGCTLTKTVAVTQSSSFSQTTNSFSGCSPCSGTGNITLTGGTAPFTYAWTPNVSTTNSASALCAGNYNITITDNVGCILTTSFTIAGSSLAATTSTIPASCGNNNGQATALPTGGASPYTYLWSPGGQTTASINNLAPGSYTVTVTDACSNVTTAVANISNLPSPTIAIASFTNVSCNGGTGSATALASGGTTPYTYSWAPTGGNNATSTPLPAGTYTVTVTDASGCSASALVSITQPPVLAQTSSIFSGCTPCSGTATITTSGGTAPYTYAWTPNVSSTNSASGLCVGNYSVVITDNNNCTLSTSFTITNNPLSATTTVVNAACGNPNGTATVIPSGGSSPYTYLWAPGGQTTSSINGLLPGTYTATVTDACSNTTTVVATVGNISGPTLTVSSFTNSTCAANCNGQIHVTAVGGTSPFSFAWSPSGGTTPNAYFLCPGTYTCTIMDALGCTGTATQTITSLSNLSASMSTVNSGCTACTGTATASGSGGIGTYTYAWSNSATTAFINNLCSANYTVTVTDSLNCHATATGNVGTNTGFVATVSSTTLPCAYSTGSGTVTMSGGVPPYTYLWTPSNQNTSTATNLYPGIYHIVVGDQSGCFASVYDTIHGPPWLSSYMTTSQMNCTSINGQAVVHPSGGTPPYTYQWSNNSTNDTAFGLAGGNYTVNVTDSHGCGTVGYATIYTACDNIVRGKVYHDPNLNCVYDGGDSPLFYTVYATPGNYMTSTNSAGDYTLHIPVPGTYTIRLSNGPNYQTHCPASAQYIHTFPNVGDTVFNYDFSQHVLPYQDIAVWMSSTPARPGFPITYTLYYRNWGNVPVNNVVLTFNHDPQLVYNASSMTPSSYTSPTATWNLGTLNPSQNGVIYVALTVPASATIGNLLCANADIMPVAGDAYTYNNYATDCRVIQGSFDPNEKIMNSALHDPLAGTIPQADSILTYTIYFQNTGTDTAFNIVLVDTLSQNVNPITIVPGPSSHPYEFEMSNGVMKFNFYNILLVDSNRNEAMSHGWVSYQVNTRQYILPGDVINNTAGIYFDYNAPVMTNMTSDTVYTIIPLGISENKTEKITAYPNPFDESTTIVLPASISGKDNEITLTDLQGRVIRIEKISGSNSFVLQRGDLESGIYFCTVRSEGKVIGVTKIMVK